MRIACAALAAVLAVAGCASTSTPEPPSANSSTPIASPRSNAHDFQIRSVLGAYPSQAAPTSKVAPGPLPGQTDDGGVQSAQTNCALPPKPSVASQTIIACGIDTPQIVYLLGPALFTQTDIKSATAAPPYLGLGGSQVNVQLTSDASARFAVVTDQASAKDLPLNQLAIVLDRQVISAPSVSARIPSGELEITGDFTLAEAQKIAADLQP